MLSKAEIKRIRNRKYRKNYLAKHRAEYNARMRKYSKESPVRRRITRGCQKRYHVKLYDLSAAMPGGGLTYEQWRARLEPLVEARREGATFRQLYKMDSVFVKRYRHVIRDIANGVPVPKFIPGTKINPGEVAQARSGRGDVSVAKEPEKSPVVENGVVYRHPFGIATLHTNDGRYRKDNRPFRERMAELVGYLKSPLSVTSAELHEAFPRMFEYYALGRAIADGREQMPDKAPSRQWLHEHGYMGVAKPTSHEPRDYAEWARRMNDLVLLVKHGVPAPAVQKSDNIVYKGWIGLARKIAAGEAVLPKLIPPKDISRRQCRRSCVTYGQWVKRLKAVADLRASGATWKECKEIDSSMCAGWKSVVEDVAGGAPIPPEDKWPKASWSKPHVKHTYDEWRGIVAELARMVHDNLPRGVMDGLSRYVWKKYGAVVHRVAAGGIVPFEVHDEKFEGSAFGGVK